MMVTFSFAKRELVVVAILLAVSFIIRVLLFPIQGYQNDISTYSYWFNTAAQQGIRPFYTYVMQNAGWIDYPPLNVYLFWAFGSLAKAASINIVFIVKLVPNLFDVATAALIFFFVRRQASFKLALMGTALYAFNPAVIYNTAVWGQFDAIYTFFIVLSLMLALKSKPKLSALFFAIAILTKPQAIALAPVLASIFYEKTKFNPIENLPRDIMHSHHKKLLRLKSMIIMAWPKIKNLLNCFFVFAATVFLLILPFEWNNPVTFLSNIYFGAYSGYAYTSVNAFNIWALYGLWISDGSLYILGWTLFGAFAVFTLYFLHKRFNVSNDMMAIFAAFMLFFAFFMFPTRIHERYLFPAISILALMFPLVKKVRVFYVALTATLLVNQAYVLYWLNDYVNKGYTYSPNLTGDPVVLAVSAINLFTLLYASILMLDELRGRGWLKTASATLKPDEEGGTQT
jgi:Gpi18-like mannosyltransferase